jgi:hypothetical protein
MKSEPKVDAIEAEDAQPVARNGRRIRGRDQEAESQASQ